MAAKTLQEVCEDTVISTLSEVAASIKCSFACGGTVPQVNNVSLHYKKQSGEWSSQPLQLPGDLTTGESPEEFLKSCSTASFGIGAETVTDKAYRDALKLEPECFFANFELESTSILSTIATVMSAGSSPSFIRAERYKLNIYSTGGHFKAHVDTPRSKEMFGSLVVCLPSEFVGGALVTRHQGRQVTFDWSSSNTTHWAAFFSDVEHEVLPVTSGYRVTITYNLYYSAEIPPQLLDVTSNRLYQELQSALQTPHFMRYGGTLGFFCQHRYVETLVDSNFSVQLPFLKGEDMIVYRIAKSLGLTVDLKAICNDGFRHNSIIPTFGQKCEHDYIEDESGKAMLRRVFGRGVKSAKKIRWCFKSNLSPVPILSALCYGNEAHLKAFYQSAALLVEVPAFSSRLAADTPIPSPAKRFKADELAVAITVLCSK